MLTAPISYADLCAYCAEQRNNPKFRSDIEWFLNSYGESYDRASSSVIKQAETEAMDEYVREYFIDHGILTHNKLTSITHGQTSKEVLHARGYL